MSGHDCIPEKDLDDETRRDFDKLILVCIKKASAIFSLANRRTDSSSHHLQEIFNLLTVIILVGVNRIFKKTVHDTGVKLDEEVVSASDYTIRVTNIPNDFADHEDIDKEIQKFISHAVPDKKLDVQRINVVYKMKEKEELYAKLKKLVRDAEKIKAKRVKGAGKMSIKKLIIAKTDELHQLNLLEDEIDSIKHTVEVMSAKFKSGKNVKEYFTGEAYLTFETQAGK